MYVMTFLYKVARVVIMAEKTKGSGVEISRSVWRCKGPRTHLFYNNKCDDKSPQEKACYWSQL